MYTLTTITKGGSNLQLLPKPKSTLFSRFVKCSSSGLELIYNISNVTDLFSLKS